MTEKQNAMEIIRFGKPEKIVWHIPEYNLTYLGCNHESFDGMSDQSPVGSRWFDIWGTGWHKIHEGVMGLPEVCPLDEPDKLDDYKWPDPFDERILRQTRDLRSRFDPKSDVYLTGRHRDTLWEKAYMLVGMENMMMYMISEPDFAKTVFHKIMDFQLGIAKTYVECGVEVVRLGDDLGTQCSLLFSKEMIREFLVPEYHRLIAFYKKHGVIVEFHSCGCIQDMTDLFIELGVDVLNPIQATANDLARIRRETEGKLCLRGGISTELIASGSKEQIEQDVKEKIQLLGKNGGYFCSPDQKIPWTDQSYAWFSEALKKYGTYPLQDS